MGSQTLPTIRSETQLKAAHHFTLITAAAQIGAGFSAFRLLEENPVVKVLRYPDYVLQTLAFAALLLAPGRELFLFYFNSCPPG
jgi:hypothetical protein